MSHSDRCLSVNRFGDGFDCVCDEEPLPKALARIKYLEADLQSQKDRMVSDRQMNRDLNECVQHLQKENRRLSGLICSDVEKKILRLVAKAKIGVDPDGEPCFDDCVQEEEICYAELERRKLAGET